MSYERTGYGLLSLGVKAPAATALAPSSVRAPATMDASGFTMATFDLSRYVATTPEQSLTSAAQEYMATRAPLATAPSSAEARAPAAGTTVSMTGVLPVFKLPGTGTMINLSQPAGSVPKSGGSVYEMPSGSAPGSTAGGGSIKQTFPENPPQQEPKPAGPGEELSWADFSDAERAQYWPFLTDGDKSIICANFKSITPQCGSYQANKNKGTADGGGSAMGIAAAAGLAALFLLKR